MFPQLCATNNGVIMTRDGMEDLDVFRLFRAFFPADTSTEDADIVHFLHTYLTYDANEIKRRSEIVGALQKNSESLLGVERIVAQHKRLSHSLSELGRSQRPLLFYTYMRHAQEAYIASIEHAQNLFNSDVPAMAEIAGAICHIRTSSFYAEVQDCLRRINAKINPLRNLTLAVNLTEAGQVAEIGISNINHPVGILNGLFNGASTQVNSLCDDVPVKIRSPLVHLEAYIVSQVETQWAASLKSVMRELKKIDMEKLCAWRDWLQHIKFYHKGLLLAEKLKQAGVCTCRPEPCDTGIAAEEMLYPHMALTKRTPVQQTIRFDIGNAVLITGANSSGKSSVLKALAQNVMLAQLGFWVPARSLRFIPFKRYFTVFAAGEDRQMIASRYQQEAEKMMAAVDSADADSFVLLNEPFTSTNPKEAAELLCDIVTRLSRKGTTLMVVTHLYDVYHLLLEAGVAVRSYVTGLTSDADKIVHTYALQEKTPDGLSYARHLAREYGFSIDRLVSDRDMASKLESFMLEAGAYHA